MWNKLQKPVCEHCGSTWVNLYVNTDDYDCNMCREWTFVEKKKKPKKPYKKRPYAKLWWKIKTFEISLLIKSSDTMI